MAAVLKPHIHTIIIADRLKPGQGEQ